MAFVATAVSTIGNVIVGNRQAKATENAGKDAASAQVYATDRTIEAQDKATERSIDYAKRYNTKATNALTKAAKTGARSRLKASLASEDALLRGNYKAAEATVGAAKDARDSMVFGSKKAEGSKVYAAGKNRDMFQQMLDQSTAELAPWRDAGAKAIKSVSSGLKGGDFSMDGWNFKADPSYEFRKEQGAQALERSAAARGSSLSGQQLAALTDFNSGLASTEYAAAYQREQSDRQNQFNNLMTVADRGQQAAGDTNAIRAGYGDRIAGETTAIGDAHAAGRMERAGYNATTAAQIGQARATQATTRGNLLSTAATYRGDVKAQRAGDVGAARAQGALNVANAANGAIQNGASVIANAYGRQGDAQANAALLTGKATADAWGNIGGTIDGAAGNWAAWSARPESQGGGAGSPYSTGNIGNTISNWWNGAG
ncbi:hypothetical protein [Amaricoccus solimangrovi]|uniref:Uncharacterized protein n=1 Tax=Amaricoccus solimangrovi TaxID=2589815 RepID=A0A501WUI3_9RHOB|nr:hypothetical protein [Amaricoccus solimangrovi]TPE53078.1 hypothetical protein FJM51_03375 [Amaricoccus solimangrovi]